MDFLIDKYDVGFSHMPINETGFSNNENWFWFLYFDRWDYDEA